MRRSNLTRENSKLVYFLGAGFSKGVVGFPTMDEFLTKEEIQKNISRYGELKQFLEQHFNFEKKEKFNLEEVFDLANKMNNRPVKTQIERYIKEELNLERAMCFKYKVEDLKQIFQKSYAIITLNYDTALENILGKIPGKESDFFKNMRDNLVYLINDFDLSFEDMIKKVARGNIILKLHGSVDWIVCKDESCCYQVRRRSVAPTGNELDNYKKIKDRGWVRIYDHGCRDCPSGDDLLRLSSLLVTPLTKNREYVNNFFPPLFKLIWLLAEKILNEATHLVIIGVSFAQTDKTLQELFRSTIGKREQKPKIEIVDKRNEVCDIAKKLTGIEPDFRGDFDAYLNEMREI